MSIKKLKKELIETNQKTKASSKSIRQSLNTRAKVS